MPLYAGVCETNITPPPDVWLGRAADMERACGVHDELYARALVLDNGLKRLALVVADLIALPEEIATRVRHEIAAALGTEPGAIMLHCTHTHGGPFTGVGCGMGQTNAACSDETYLAILIRKLIGVARQAADLLQPASLIYGEASAQIGVNRRQAGPNGRMMRGRNYGGPVSSLVQTLCVNGVDGRTFALLGAHACHPTTMDGTVNGAQGIVASTNQLLTADWPGAAVAHLKERFFRESAETGIASDALPIFLQGCCGDVDPLRRGDWEAVRINGRVIADAAHTARWNAHGQLGDALDFAEITVMLPLLPSKQLSEQKELIDHDPQDTLLSQPFTIQKLTLGGAALLGFPAEMSVRYQQDFCALSTRPLFCLGYTNGYWGCLSPQDAYAQGSEELEEADKHDGTFRFTPDCNPLVRQAVRHLLDSEESE